MLEQPVALAIIARSPTNWLSSFRYGVSPQPAQAPENSKSGSRSWTFLTVVQASPSAFGKSGRPRKKSQFSFSAARSGSTGAMLIALRLASVLSLTGQISTQRVQPVQSSGLTWSVYRWSGSSRQRAGADLKVEGASSSSVGSYTFDRMTACGQTITHL